MRAAATGGVIGALALVVLGTMPALAQTCAGVEWRVNAQTIALQGVVSGQIESAQAAMLALDQANRARLLSALKVMTKQESASTDQTVLMEQKAGEAAASAITTSTRNQEIAAAQNRYRATGYGACAVGTKASSFYAAVKAAPQARTQILQTVSWKPGAYGSQSAWASGVGAEQARLPERRRPGCVARPAESAVPRAGCPREALGAGGRIPLPLAGHLQWTGAGLLP